MAGRYQRNGGPTSSMATACRHFLPLLDDPQIGRRDEQHDQAEQDAAAVFGHLQDGEQRRQHGEDQRADVGLVMSPRSPLPGTFFQARHSGDASRKAALAHRSDVVLSAGRGMRSLGLRK